MELWPHIHCEPLNETDPETRSTSGLVPESQLVSDFHYSRTSVFLSDLLLNDSYSSLPTLDQQEPQKKKARSSLPLLPVIGGPTTL